MTTVMHIHIETGHQREPFAQGLAQFVGMGGITYGPYVVPTPYQCGDCPDEMFAEKHGVRGRMKQYGQQPRMWE